MQPNHSQQSNTRRLYWLSFVLLAATFSAAAYFFFITLAPQAEVPKPSPRASVVDNTNRNDPSESYETFLHVLNTGGCENTRPAAIAWLDRFAGQNLTLPNNQVMVVLAMIEKDAHPSWEQGYRQHIFNSAFNALHLCPTGETFTRQLLRLAEHDSDRTMRLYAMQHLNMQRRIGHLPDGALATETLKMFTENARQPKEETSGYALQVLTNWNGETATQDPDVIRLALATAADLTRPNDVRVSALFAAGKASLELARQLAADSAQPIHLRKTAVACLGDYGNESDLVILQKLSSESSRLAQAADPAHQNIRHRLTNPQTPKLISY
ncbi:MAG: hypothetical protein V4727_08115 [Verrucomicrobiota bacterium]